MGKKKTPKRKTKKAKSKKSGGKPNTRSKNKKKKASKKTTGTRPEDATEASDGDGSSDARPIKDASHAEQTEEAPPPPPVLRYEYRAADGPVAVYVANNCLVFQTPYDDVLLDRFRAQVPKKARQFFKESGVVGLPFDKAWWVTDPAFWDATEDLIETHFGVGTAGGACRWLHVLPSAPAAVIATAYFSA